MTGPFTVALQHGIWRVSLNGAFYGDYRTERQAKDAIAEAERAIAQKTARLPKETRK